MMHSKKLSTTIDPMLIQILLKVKALKEFENDPVGMQKKN